MDKIIAFFNQTDCRDKMLKIIQYGSRFIAWILSKEDEEELEKKFRNLFSNSFRLNSNYKRFKKNVPDVKNT
jgi:peroxin-11B